MGMSAFRVKRTLMAPLIAHRKRKLGPQDPLFERMMAHAGYSPAMWNLMVTTALDPDYLYRADLDETSVVLDVGAYAGDTVKRFRDLYGCRVYAFEPHPVQVPKLEAMFADDPTITVCPYGLGPRDATLPLAMDGPGSSVYGRTHRDWATRTVAIRDVISVLDELGIDEVDLLKVNIEGAEFDLLDRLIDAEVLQRVRYVLVQFHEWHEQAYYRRWKIRRTLRKTHDQIWDFPWLWELWCARSAPHPGDATPDDRSAAPPG